MASIKYSKMYLEKDEAEALFTTGINNDCPAGFFCPTRKVWWVIEGENGSFPYTLCQKCYHNNNFGEENESVKELLQPVMMQGVPCSCDGIKQEDAFPINYNDYKIGIYEIQPKTVLLNGTKEDDNIIIATEEDKFTYAICIICYDLVINNADQLECKMFDKDNNVENVIYTAPSVSQNNFRIDIIGTLNSISHTIKSNKFDIADNLNANTKRIQLIFDDNVILEFNIVINHINKNETVTDIEYDNTENEEIMTVNI